MKVLVVDMTHGGGLISLEFMKNPEFDVLAYDIYNSMDSQKVKELENAGLSFIQNLDGIKEYDNPKSSDLMIIAPIHCKLDQDISMTHHEAVGFLLNDKIDVPVIEVTGVKGKTSVVWMLKEIFKDKNPLVLSSLGVEVIENNDWKILKEDISITPASIIEAWKLAEDYQVGICIFETSLGGTGLADVGIITNIAEDYTIANNSSIASKAKLQMFKSKAVACEIEAFNSNYSKFNEKTNTFGKSEESKNCANLTASQINYRFDKTHFQININDFQISSNNIINQSFELSTFAPSPIHITNTLAAVCASLTIGASIEKIKEGLNNFKGVKGRTTVSQYEGIRIIEEINPGLNIMAVKKALLMIDNMERVVVIFGGKYGVTCEEIDETSVSEVLNELNENIRLLLVDELGQGVKSNLNRKFSYFNDLDDAIKCVFNSKCSNLLIIYRSNYSDLKKR